MLSSRPNVGIVGLGSLGSTMQRYFSERGLATLCHDKNGTGSLVEVNRAEFVFICVNTPFDQSKQNIDLSYVVAALGALEGAKVVVIRSTVPPGTTAALQVRFPHHQLLFNPEFLRAATAYEDFIKPPRQIIGVTKQSQLEAQGVLALLPSAPAEYTAV
ncbi:MAG: hypothetical protein U1C53_00375, partial [Candidatus Veblenbacteria bacterium]|nr:hypothetical protein [Candidatus Veblenbacteria bacterium]